MLALVYFPWEGTGLQYRRSCLSALRTSETHRGGTGRKSREGSQRRVEVADPPEPSEPSASRAHPSGKTLPERTIHALLLGHGAAARGWGSPCVAPGGQAPAGAQAWLTLLCPQATCFLGSLHG